MTGRQTYDQVYETELKKLTEFEAEKRLLHDKTVGGERGYRPSPKQTLNITGELKSNKQLELEAAKKAHAKMQEQTRAHKQRDDREKVKSNRDRLKEPDERDLQSNRDKLKQQDNNRSRLTQEFNRQSKLER